MHRTIVITGATSGAGKAIALNFARQKDHLVLASRNFTELNEVALECEHLGAIVRCVETDVSDFNAVLNLAGEAEKFHHGIDVWINNAGVLAVGLFDNMPMAVTEQVIKTNMMGYIYGAYAALPYFKKRGRGIIVNNISVGGFLPVPYGVGYSAGKFGLRGFSMALKTELTEFPDIHVCDAYPAFLDTPGIQHAANYTGKQLKPAPPVYDPARIAQEISKIVKNPRAETMIGSTSVLLRLSQTLFPGLTQTIAGAVIKQYINQAKEIDKTDGNVFMPVKYGNAVYGGWGIPGKPKAHHKYIAGGLMLLAATGFLLAKKR